MQHFCFKCYFFAIFTHRAVGALGRKRIPIIDIRLAHNPMPKKIPSFAGCNFYLAILLAPWAKHGLYGLSMKEMTSYSNTRSVYT